MPTTKALELTDAEAQAIALILGSVGGDPETSRRGDIDMLRERLLWSGYDWHDHSSEILGFIMLQPNRKGKNGEAYLLQARAAQAVLGPKNTRVDRGDSQGDSGDSGAPLTVAGYFRLFTLPVISLLVSLWVLFHFHLRWI